jgi:hypothetical protein
MFPAKATQASGFCRVNAKTILKSDNPVLLRVKQSCQDNLYVFCWPIESSSPADFAIDISFFLMSLQYDIA